MTPHVNENDVPQRHLGGLASGASGCGWSVSAAREAAATKACGYFHRCDAIGSGKQYASTTSA